MMLFQTNKQANMREGRGEREVVEGEMERGREGDVRGRRGGEGRGEERRELLKRWLEKKMCK